MKNPNFPYSKRWQASTAASSLEVFYITLFPASATATPDSLGNSCGHSRERHCGEFIQVEDVVVLVDTEHAVYGAFIPGVGFGVCGGVVNAVAVLVVFRGSEYFRYLVHREYGIGKIQGR